LKVKLVAKLALILSLLAAQACGSRPAPEPSTGSTPARTGAARSSDEAIADGPAGMILIKGGTFRMGTDEGMPFEGPAHDVTLKPFWIDRREVTVGEFARFVEATGYKTEAERFGWSGVFDAANGEWHKRDGADWRRPEGPGHPAAAADEPVTQVSWNDARAYAAWAGKRLPTEAEWEYAARGGLAGKRYSWGDELRPGGRPAANWWQGRFPSVNTVEDGFAGRAPVGSFAPNGYDLYDTGGNVWEWCADWFGPEYYAQSPSVNPMGPAAGEERVIRGGSWMCSENYCTNYRVAGRGHTSPDTGLNNLGFRCARDI